MLIFVGQIFVVVVVFVCFMDCELHKLYCAIIMALISTTIIVTDNHCPNYHHNDNNSHTQ